MRIRAQSLAVGDKIRARELRGTVVKVERNINEITLKVTIHVVVTQASGKIVCKDFHPGYVVTILEREVANV